MYAPSEERYPEQRAFTMALYVISALGAIVQYAESVGMNVAGCIVLAVAGFMAKAQRLTAKGTIYASHVEWITRTMSIGSYILFPFAIGVILYGVYAWTDIESPRKALEASDSKDMVVLINIVKEYITNNESRIDRITTWSITLPILWWVRRCWYGFIRARKSEPIDYPHSFL